MLQFAPNLTTLFTEFSFLERFKEAKKLGFSNVEFQFPYAFSAADINQKLIDNELACVLFNLPAGDWETGERGIAIFPNRIEEFRESVALGIEYALFFGTKNIHCLAGVLSSELSKEEALATYEDNLLFAANELKEHDITLLIEPINPFDMPGYFLTDVNDAMAIIQKLALPNLKLQLDFYHLQRIQGELVATWKRYKDKVGHIQIADNPGRHEPGTGEIHYDFIFKMLRQHQYSGYIGLEYTPLAKTETSFSWLTNDT